MKVASFSFIRTARRGHASLRVAIAFLFTAFTAPASDVSQPNIANAFDSANRLYAEGKFNAAATGYEGLIRSNGVSQALWFNLGNDQFKSGNLGRAIAAYREAEQLDPRDGDLRANLQFARTRFTGTRFHARFWERWLGNLTLNEWSCLAAAAIWCVFGLLTARQIRPSLSPGLRPWLFLSTAFSVLFLACLGMRWTLGAKQGMAIVAEQEVSIRTSPFDESPGVPNRPGANDGAELRVLDQKNDWLQVTDPASRGRRIGWVKSEQVVLFPRD